MLKLCLQCGEEIPAESQRQKFCSDKCCQIYHRRISKRKKKKSTGTAPKATFTKICPACGVIFETKCSFRKYCSDKCYFCYANERAKQRRAEDKQILQALRPHAFKKVGTGKNNRTLENWIDEAAQCNMSYGKYRYAVEHLGKTFEELKANA